MYFLKARSFFSNREGLFTTKGKLVKAFAGQEILVYSDPVAKENLFFGGEKVGRSKTEIDYLVQIKDQAVSIKIEI